MGFMLGFRLGLFVGVEGLVCFETQPLPPPAGLALFSVRFKFQIWFSNSFVSFFFHFLFLEHEALVSTVASSLSC